MVAFHISNWLKPLISSGPALLRQLGARGGCLAVLGEEVSTALFVWLAVGLLLMLLDIWPQLLSARLLRCCILFLWYLGRLDSGSCQCLGSFSRYLSHSLALSLSFSHMLPLSLSHSLTLSISLTHSLYLSPICCLSLSLSLSFALFCSHSNIFTLSLSHSFSFALSQALSVCLLSSPCILSHFLYFTLSNTRSPSLFSLSPHFICSRRLLAGC